MVDIQNPMLKKQFEQFSKLNTDDEKKAFWETFNKEFESQNKAEQDAMREAWLANVSNIEQRIKAIDNQLDRHVAEISVFPANAEEANLLTALLERMGVKFVVG